ncbi:hypothetical protein C8N35_11618 [Breoghania corrubedonensis]|uniref:Lipoprotein n=1 Tax=Breoghania corrubedonensis TaxID=665038 RepID=A0A2T5UPZ0_9HYPH|nr:hypothetical protein [Breoghania corrubedonensis]PTW53563.1 hypothetical protein C8N35_11618 [Breoghania corrubedonensis]
MRALLVFALPLLIAGCASTDVMKLSQNEIAIDTSAAPICGAAGAARVAQRMAAAETIKAGYDRYQIVATGRDSSVHAVQMPGSYNTTGSMATYGNYGSFNATTTYTPGPTFVAGRHHQQLVIRLFKNGEQGSANAISARGALGPKWQEIIKRKSLTCSVD